jgi:hypothetical protein
MGAIQQLSPTHVQIMDWIIANPHRSLGECAATFGYTQAWVSQIIHSDCFQAMLAAKQVELFGEVRLTVRDRIIGLAHESLRRLTEKVAVEQDIEKVTNAADLSLRALGFGAKAAPPPVGAGGMQQNNYFVGSVDRETLERARALMHKPQQELPAPVEVEVLPVPATQ